MRICGSAAVWRSLIPNLNLAPLSTAYVSFTTGDFNGDGFDDLQASRNPQDICLGGPSGLTGCFETQAMPSGYDDGKYLTLSGSGLTTIGTGQSSFYINLAAGTESFLVDIFDGAFAAGDGDMGRGSNETCFRLTPDGLKQGAPVNTDQSIATVSSTQLPSRAWGKVYFGPAAHPLAEAPSGNYFYRLDVYLAASCEVSCHLQAQSATSAQPLMQRRMLPLHAPTTDPEANSVALP